MFGKGVSFRTGGDSGGAPAVDHSGFGSYRDSAWLPQAPFPLRAHARTLMPNDGAIRMETELPSDVASFYDPTTGRISGTVNSDTIITVRARVKPTDAYASFLMFEIDSGTDRFPSIVDAHKLPLAWGQDETAVSCVFSTYCAGTFASTGARIFITSDGDLSLYGISFLIKRTHKGLT